MSSPGSTIHEVYPYLCVRGAAAAIDFYTRVFGAQEILRLSEPGGRIADTNGCSATRSNPEGAAPAPANLGSV